MAICYLFYEVLGGRGASGGPWGRGARAYSPLQAFEVPRLQLSVIPRPQRVDECVGGCVGGVDGVVSYPPLVTD